MQKEYTDKLVSEIIAKSADYPDYCVSSIFIGGGTPSILKAELIADILKACNKSFDIAEKAEITIEANPGTLTEEKLKVYKGSGINRISLGLQSANDNELKELGRIHTYDSFLKSYQRVRMLGYHNVNIDLMSALPGQTIESWKETLKKVTMLRPEHISAYSLIIEEGTPFYEKYGEDKAGLPDEDTEREMYELTKTFLREQGYKHYEISNYAREGCECRHNIGYWTGTEYLGFGLGASSYAKGFRLHNTEDLKFYLKWNPAKMSYKDLTADKERLTEQAEMEEFMFLGLRMIDGVTEKEFYRRFHKDIWVVYGTVIRRQVDLGLLQVVDDRIRFTSRGIDVSNRVMSEFLL